MIHQKYEKSMEIYLMFYIELTTQNDLFCPISHKSDSLTVLIKLEHCYNLHHIEIQVQYSELKGEVKYE